MERKLVRFLRRLLVAAIGVLTVWLIVFVIFKFADNRLNWMLASRTASIADCLPGS